MQEEEVSIKTPLRTVLLYVTIFVLCIDVLACPYHLVSNEIHLWVSPPLVGFGFGMLLGLVTLRYAGATRVLRSVEKLAPALFLVFVPLVTWFEWFYVFFAWEGSPLYFFFEWGVRVDIDVVYEDANLFLLTCCGALLSLALMSLMPSREEHLALPHDDCRQTRSISLRNATIGSFGLFSALLIRWLTCSFQVTSIPASIPFECARITMTLMLGGILLLILSHLIAWGGIDCAGPLADICIVFFASGLIAWGAFARCVSRDAYSIASFILVAFSCIAFLGFFCAYRRSRASKNSDQSERVLIDYLAAAGLAPRELAIVTRYLDGISSSALADELGIRPATVRSALQRSYKKLGVRNREELFTRVSQVKNEKDSSSHTRFLGIRLLDIEMTQDGIAGGRRICAVLLVLFALAGFLLLFPSVLSPKDWGFARSWIYAVGAALSILALFLWAVGYRGAASEAADRCVRTDPFIVASLILTSAFLGFAWEELWRNASLYPLPELTLPIELILLCGSLAVLFRIRGKFVRGAAPLLLFVALDLLILGRKGVFLASFCLNASMVFISMKICAVSEGTVYACLAAFGLCSIGADVIVNLACDMLWGNDAFTLVYGGREAFAMMLTCVVLFISLIVFSIFTVACRNLLFLADETRSALSSAARGRVLSYLKGRGLNETQANVLLLIAEGGTSASISVALSYSRGAVNSARKTGYAKLGIHDRFGLVRLLSQHTGL